MSKGDGDSRPLSEKLANAKKRARTGEKRSKKGSSEELGFADTFACLEKAECAAISLEAAGIEPTLDQVLLIAQYSVLDDISNVLDTDD